MPFYLKMGYHYKDGITTPDEEHLIRLEKLNASDRSKDQEVILTDKDL